MAAKAAPVITSKSKICDLNAHILLIRSLKIAIFHCFNKSFVTEPVINSKLSHSFAIKIKEISIKM